MKGFGCRGNLSILVVRFSAASESLIEQEPSSARQENDTSIIEGEKRMDDRILRVRNVPMGGSGE